MMGLTKMREMLRRKSEQYRGTRADPYVDIQRLYESMEKLTLAVEEMDQRQRAIERNNSTGRTGGS